MGVKAFIFDMDGILLDTESICDRAWIICAGVFGLSQETVMDAINLCRGTNKAQTRIILGNLFGKDFPVEQFMAQTSIEFKKIEAAEGISKKAYAAEILDYLKGRGYRLALASSTRGVIVEKQLTESGLIDYFECKVCGDQVEHSKPNPEIYLKAAELLQVDPKECVGVEDSPNGLKSAKTAGMITIMIPDRIKPDEETLKFVDYEFENLWGITRIY